MITDEERSAWRALDEKVGKLSDALRRTAEEAEHAEDCERWTDPGTGAGADSLCNCFLGDVRDVLKP